MTKRQILLLVLCLQCVVMMAQFSDPREKLGITASVDGSTNTDYKWKTEDGELLEKGRMKPGINARLRVGVKLLGTKRFSMSFSPFYNFSNRRMSAYTDGPQLNLYIPNEHHHYGGAVSATYSTQLFGKPFIVAASVTGNFSQYGYENFSTMGTAMFTITRNRSTYLALGALCLVGTSVSWPLYPMIIYTHRFNDRWSVNCFETNNYLNYHVSPKLRCALGMEIVTDKIYLRPDRKDMPRKTEISELSERFGLFADYQATKDLALNFGMGATVPFYMRLRESGYNKTYMRMYDHVKPFVKLQLKYTIQSQSKQH